jgi:HlyD family secretion protein
MKKRVAVIALFVAVLLFTVVQIAVRAEAPKHSAPAPGAREWAISAPGRVEPVSEDIKLTAEISGKLKQVYVEEGQRVHRGQVLAELVNDDYKAAVASYEAEIKLREAELEKTINGALRQERRETYSAVQQQQAVMDQAKSEMERRQKLYDARVISKEESERAQRDYEVARARYDETLAHNMVVDRDARHEDRAIAEANLASARAHLEQARATLAKTYLRSPIDGVVLKKHHRIGESISVYSSNPDPVLTLGDTNVLRVRVDVDEADVSKLRLGQKAWVTADAYGDRRFTGHVVRIGEQLGRKNLRTEEPTEHVDTKILETLVELDEGQQLPLGLRVSAFIAR